MDETVFLVQPYVARATGLVAQPARVFADATSARRAGGKLSHFRAGVVVLSQRVGAMASRRSRPETIAVFGRVPEAWRLVDEAA